MPKMRPGAFRASVIIPAGVDRTDGVKTCTDAVLKHIDNVPTDDLGHKAWFAAPDSGGEGLTMGSPVAKSRWTKDGNLTVEAC